jgi:PAS domain S-box-containing protein
MPVALSWALLAYAMLTVLVGSAFVALHIRIDYLQTLDAERSNLRDVTAALASGTLATLEDGIGAAHASAAEVRASGGLDRMPQASLVALLQRQLAGGEYVRALYLADRGRTIVASRSGALDASATPSWLEPAQNTTADVWVGSPIPDPQSPSRLVVPIARRVMTGAAVSGWGGALFSFTGFENLSRAFGGRLMVLALVRADGTLLATVTRNHPGRYTGRSVAQNPAFQESVRTGRGGVVQGVGEYLKVRMIYGYQPIRGYPIYVLAGQSRDAVLAGWRARRAQSIAAAAAFDLVALMLTAFLGHYMHALRTRERDYRALFNSAQFAVFLLEGDRFVDANHTVATMFGLATERMAVGLTPWQLSPERQPNGRLSMEAAHERIATALREGGSTFPWMHRRADTGEAFPAEVDLSSLETGGTTLTLAVVHDVTARERAQQELRRLSAELMKLQDAERRRIGRELHDSTGQQLAALELELSMLASEIGTLSAHGREQLERCVRLARQCSTEIRTASYLLHPPLLDELGLLSALRWLAHGVRERGGLEVRLELPESLQRLAPEAELALFRVAQEALANVLRHSASPWVAIRLRVQSQILLLEVQDGGRGIARAGAQVAGDPASAPGGVGVAGMRERIRGLGGSFALDSTPTGTRVRVMLPLETWGQASRTMTDASESTA